MGPVRVEIDTNFPPALSGIFGGIRRFITGKGYVILFAMQIAPCAVSDGTAWDLSAWAGNGPHARNFMRRLLLPVIVVRPRRMKFLIYSWWSTRLRLPAS